MENTIKTITFVLSFFFKIGVGARRDEPLQQQLVGVLCGVLRQRSTFAPTVCVAALHELAALVDELGPSAALHGEALLNALSTLTAGGASERRQTSEQVRDLI